MKFDSSASLRKILVQLVKFLGNADELRIKNFAKLFIPHKEESLICDLPIKMQ